MYQSFSWRNSKSDALNDLQLHSQGIINKNLWYHGAIPRYKAEALVKENGDFLVRDSVSKKGDYVLTCFWNGSPLHFMVNRQVCRNSDSGVVKVQYQFEQELCDTIPQLINLYVKTKKCVSESSGAVISQPVNRRVSVDTFLSKQNTDLLNLVRVASKTLHKSGSQPLLSVSDSSSTLYSTEKPEYEILDGSVSPKKSCGAPFDCNNGSTVNISSKHVLTSPIFDKGKAPPPKPSRVPTLKLRTSQRPRVTIKNKQLYEDENDYSDYSAVKSWPTDLKQTPVYRAVLSEFYFTASCTRSTLKHPTSETSTSVEENRMCDVTAVTLPDMTVPSKFESYEYHSKLLTCNNKPLEKLSLSIIMTLLQDTDMKALAMHLTLLDLDLFSISGSYNLGVGVISGLELITLPQGAQLRRDALERFHCLKYFVVTSILLCSQITWRVQMISQWIQIANEAKMSLGNLYAFAYIMEALQSPQILRLKNTWIAMQLHHKSTSHLYDTRLKTAYKSMLNADTALPLHNVTLPFVIPVIRFLKVLDLQSQDTVGNIEKEEVQNIDLDVVLAHLDIARIFSEQYGFYRVRSEHIFGNFQPVRDILELFDTRMHLRFLWGAKGISIAPVERYKKYNEILHVLSQNCEPCQNVDVTESSV